MQLSRITDMATKMCVFQNTHNNKMYLSLASSCGAGTQTKRHNLCHITGLWSSSLLYQQVDLVPKILQFSFFLYMKTVSVVKNLFYKRTRIVWKMIL